MLYRGDPIESFVDRSEDSDDLPDGIPIKNRTRSLSGIIGIRSRSSRSDSRGVAKGLCIARDLVSLIPSQLRRSDEIVNQVLRTIGQN